VLRLQQKKICGSFLGNAIFSIYGNRNFKKKRRKYKAGK